MITARFTLTAPLSHSAFGMDAGNAVPLRRMRIATTGCEVPVVSGNALRASLRRVLMRELLSALDLGPSTEGLQWDRLYAALANGGTIEAAEKRLDPARIRHYREALPAVSVLGAAMYKWLLSGHVRVGILWPVCRETAEVGLVTSPSSFSLPAVGELEAEYSTSRLPDTEIQSPEVSGVGPMPVTIEVLSPGTVLESHIGFAAHAPEIERSAIAHGLSLLTHLGGKSGSGMGTFALTTDGADSESYRAWLSDAEALSAARQAIFDLQGTF